jgi:hypothetical protein
MHVCLVYHCRFSLVVPLPSATFFLRVIQVHINLLAATIAYSPPTPYCGSSFMYISTLPTSTLLTPYRVRSVWPVDVTTIQVRDLHLLP